MSITYMPLPAPVGATTADVGRIRIVPLSFTEKPLVQSTTDAALAHVQAMHALAALSFDPNSMDRDSEVDIWGFTEPE
jgi:hypothetical protein